MADEFILYVSLKKNDYIEIVLKNNRKGRGYVTGFSGGKLEVKSSLGDGLDLVGTDKLFNQIIDRYYLTVSMVNKIEIVKLNNLGKIE